MTWIRTTIAASATLAALLAPATASAEYLVPEGNSAVSQYTEGVPSAGGEKGTRNGETKEPVSPGKTIGAGNAKKLDEQGSEGQAAAEVAAETAPPTPAASESGESSGSGNGKHQAAGGGGKGGSGSGGSGASAEGGGTSRHVEDAGGGASGLKSLIAAATGSEDGHLGLLLPLVVIASLAAGIAYALHQRKRPVPR